VRQILLAAIGVYLLIAIVTRAAEATGVGRNRLSCGCEPNCWCKRSSLTMFRWVTPRRTHHLLTAADKRMLEESKVASAS